MATVVGLLGVLGIVSGPALALAPSNDNFADRISIAKDTLIAFDGAGATTEPIDYELVSKACGIDLPTDFELSTVWYDFTPTQDELLTIVGSTDFAIASGEPGAFVGEACSIANRVLDARAGTTYHISLATQGAAGTFSVAVPPPPPTVTLTVDRSATVDFVTNTVTVGGTFSCAGSTDAQLFASVEQSVGRRVVSGFVGQIVGPCDGIVHRWTGQPQFSITGLWRGGSVRVPSALFACNAGGCSVAVLDNASASLKVVRGTPPPPPPPPPPLSVVVTFDPTGTVDLATNIVTLTGTTKCSGGGEAFLSGTLRQVAGRLFVDGFAFSDIGTCDGTLQHWSVQVIGPTGRYTGGPVTLIDQGIVQCDEFSCVGNAVSAPTINLRPVGHRSFGTVTFGDPELAVNFDHRVGLDNASSTAVVAGSLTCTPGIDPASLSVQGQFVQLVGRTYIRMQTFGDLIATCDGVPHRFSVRASLFPQQNNSVLAPGRAVLDGGVVGFDVAGNFFITSSTANVSLTPVKP